MGRSVNAYLAYGVDFAGEAVEALPWNPLAGSEDDFEGSDDEPKSEFGDWLCEIAGLDDPSAHLIDRDQTWEAWYANPDNEQAMKEFWRMQRELVVECPIEEVVYYSEELGLLVAVKGTVNKADWAEPIEPMITVDEARLQSAREFCAEHGIPFETPKWILVAYSDT
jgi:hypothetical protein